MLIYPVKYLYALNGVLPVQRTALQSPSLLQDFFLLPKRLADVSFRPESSIVAQSQLPLPLKDRLRFADCRCGNNKMKICE